MNPYKVIDTFTDLFGDKVTVNPRAYENHPAVGNAEGIAIESDVMAPLVFSPAEARALAERLFYLSYAAGAGTESGAAPRSLRCLLCGQVLTGAPHPSADEMHRHGAAHSTAGDIPKPELVLFEQIG